MVNSSSTSGVAVRPAAALTWYRVYSILLVLTCLVTIVVGAAIASNSGYVGKALVERGRIESADDASGFGIVLLFLGILEGSIAGSSWFFPRARWGWISRLLILFVGFVACCLLWPISVITLIHWFRPETQEYYGMR